MRSEATQSTGVGEVMTKTENAVRTSPAIKMIRAWNEMSEKICAIRAFLNASGTTYGTWKDDVYKFSQYRPINQFGI
jgi:hypothetical protein